MTTLNMMAYNLADMSGKADDISFINRMKFSIIYYRALFIRRDMQNQVRIPEHFIQSFCVDMEVTNGSNCCDIDLDCIIYKSVKPIPKHINFKDRNPFLYVGTIDNKKPYSPVSMGELAFLQYNTYTGKMPRYFMQNGHLYIVNSKSPKLTIKGIFEDPRELSQFDCVSGDCYSDDEEFPISSDMVQRITQAIMGGELQGGQTEDKEVKIDE